MPWLWKAPAGCWRRWESATNMVYRLCLSTNLAAGFETQSPDIAATPPLNVYTDAVEELDAAMYRIRAYRNSQY